MTDSDTSELCSGLIDVTREELSKLRTFNGTVLDEILGRVLARDPHERGPDVSAFNSSI